MGTDVRVRHLRATPGGGRLTFLVRAVDGTGSAVAEGEVDRAVVDREKFLAG
ncbi:hypothetical protein ACWEG1_23650 [Streptomyces bauhiniae]